MESSDARALLKEIKDRFLDVLGGKLVGFYCHGSLAMGCFNAGSDIDFLAVTAEKLRTDEKLALLKLLCGLTDRAPKKGLEMSVVTRGVCDPFAWPTPYELHYSPAWRTRYLENPLALCGEELKYDPDLAAHFAMTRARGQALFGPAPEAMFAPVPDEWLLESFRSDLEDAEEVMADNAVYVTLNLCRALAWRREGALLSKKEGGEWALKTLDPAACPIVRSALAAYAAGEAFDLSAEAGRAFARMMRAKILA